MRFLHVWRYLFRLSHTKGGAFNVLGPFVVLYQFRQIVGLGVPVSHHQHRARLTRCLGQRLFRQVVGLNQLSQDAAELFE